MRKLFTALCLFFSLGTAAQLSAQNTLVWGGSPFQDSIWSMDTTTWTVVHRISPSLGGSTITGITAMAYDPCGHKSYAVLKLSGVTGRPLVTIDLPTGVCTLVGNLGDNFSSITFDENGQLYGVTGDGATVPETFYSINKSTAAVTLITPLGVGADGEIICYNQWNGRMFHWSGNSTVEHQKFYPVAPHSFSPISTGPPFEEVFGGISLGPNHFLISLISENIRYADTLGNYDSIPALWPTDVRGLIMLPGFVVLDDTICPNVPLEVSAFYANLWDVVYEWGDGTSDTISGLDPAWMGSGEHYYATPGNYTLNVYLAGACGDSLMFTDAITVFNLPGVVITPDSNVYLCPGDSIALMGSSGGTSQWYMNGVMIPGATSNTLWVSSPGNYNMTKTNLNGCTDSASVGALVMEVPAPDAIGTLPDTGFATFPISPITNSSTGTSWFWDFGDITSSTDSLPSKTYMAPGIYSWMLIVSDSCGRSDTLIDSITILDSLLSASAFALNQVSMSPGVPNPFSETTTLVIHTPAMQQARLVIRNLMGEEVSVLHSGNLPAGDHRFIWNGSLNNGTPAASGLYFISLETPAGVISRPSILMR